MRRRHAAPKPTQPVIRLTKTQCDLALRLILKQLSLNDDDSKDLLRRDLTPGQIHHVR